MFVFVLFEKNTENEVCVRERHFHWWARDREVARTPESGCRALLSCPMAYARQHSRAVSCARATAARTAKPFPAPALGVVPLANSFGKFWLLLDVPIHQGLVWIADATIPLFLELFLFCRPLVMLASAIAKAARKSAIVSCVMKNQGWLRLSKKNVSLLP